MKKIIVSVFALIAFAAAAIAQPRAVGVRGGYGVEVSYQQSIKENQFVEADLGWGFHVVPGVSTESGCYLSGIYDFVLFNVSDFGLYVGPGLGIGFYNHEGKASIDGSILGQVGVEYKFRFPLSLSVDWRPLYSFNNSFNLRGVALGVRYRF